MKKSLAYAILSLLIGSPLAYGGKYEGIPLTNLDKPAPKKMNVANRSCAQLVVYLISDFGLPEGTTADALAKSCSNLADLLACQNAVAEIKENHKKWPLNCKGPEPED